MLIKFIIVVLFILVVGSLISAMFHLLTSTENNNKTLRALKFRIGLSVLAFVILIVSVMLGWIQPHGIGG